MIGVFDSGSGGLTVLKEIRTLAPQIDVVYFGDIANLPYGEKSPEELGALTTIIIEKLLEEGAENIVSACNSVSASVAQPLISLLGKHRFGMVEMVGPTVRALLTEAGTGKHIGLVATPATVRSGIYQKAFAQERVTIETHHASGLVDAIEAGEEGSEEVEMLVYKAVKDLVVKQCGILVLGCTQYPFVQAVFEDAVKNIGVDMSVYNPALAVAEETVLRFGDIGSGKLRFIISKDSDFFRKMVQDLFGGSTIEVL